MSLLAADQLALLRALGGDYGDWVRNAKAHRVDDGLTVVVAAPDDILRSKEACGREKDRAALPQMREDFRASGAL